MMLKSLIINLTLALLLFMLAACFPSRIQKYSNIYLSNDTAITLSDHPKNEIKVLYTGCGGMVINSDSFSVLIDPFYSYTGLSMLWKKLATDKAQVENVCRQIDAKCDGTDKIRTVLIAHSHYDHLLDLPYLLTTRLKDQHLNIIGSESTLNALSPVLLAHDTFRIPQISKEKYYDTFQLNPQMKLTVIKSDHAPHIRFLGLNIKLMNGSIGPGGVKGFDTSAYKSWFYKWKEGEDYSFLIEIQKPGNQKPFRIFIQSSSCKPPAGIPQFLTPDASIDLAFIGVASANNVSDYPDSLLKVIKPAYVVLIHWEDFFRSYTKEPEIVRATNFKTFLSRYKKVMGSDYASHTTMPKQLIRYQFLY